MAPKSSAKGGKTKAPKSQSKFVPRKSSIEPRGGSASLALPRKKNVLSGPNAGQK